MSTHPHDAAAPPAITTGAPNPQDPDRVPDPMGVLRALLVDDDTADEASTAAEGAALPRVRPHAPGWPPGPSGHVWDQDEIVEVFLLEDPDTGRTRAFADAGQAVEWADLSGIVAGEPAEVIGPELAAEMIVELREQAASDAD